MYSRLNLIFNELDYINITNLGDVDIVIKTFFVLRHNKYVSIIIVLHNMENLSIMILGFVTGKLAVFDISRKMGQEKLLYQEMHCSHMQRSQKGKGQSSLSEDEDDDYDNDEANNQPSTLFFKVNQDDSEDEPKTYLNVLHIKKLELFFRFNFPQQNET
jgi:hypothetical protein